MTRAFCFYWSVAPALDDSGRVQVWLHARGGKHVSDVYVPRVFYKRGRMDSDLFLSTLMAMQANATKALMQETNT